VRPEAAFDIAVDATAYLIRVGLDGSPTTSRQWTSSGADALVVMLTVSGLGSTVCASAMYGGDGLAVPGRHGAFTLPASPTQLAGGIALLDEHMDAVWAVPSPVFVFNLTATARGGCAGIGAVGVPVSVTTLAGVETLPVDPTPHFFEFDSSGRLIHRVSLPPELGQPFSVVVSAGPAGGVTFTSALPKPVAIAGGTATPEFDWARLLASIDQTGAIDWWAVMDTAIATVSVLQPRVDGSLAIAVGAAGGDRLHGPTIDWSPPEGTDRDVWLLLIDRVAGVISANPIATGPGPQDAAAIIVDGSALCVAGTTQGATTLGAAKPAEFTDILDRAAWLVRVNSAGSLDCQTSPGRP
jgi:hypothetical protein